MPYDTAVGAGVRGRNGFGALTRHSAVYLFRKGKVVDCLDDTQDDFGRLRDGMPGPPPGPPQGPPELVGPFDAPGGVR